MKYGSIELKVLFDTLSITKKKKQEVRHYPNTDKSDVSDQGKPPTIITCQLKAESISERVLLEQLSHSSAEAELYFADFYYEKVVTGDNWKLTPKSSDKKLWFCNAQFIALDPVPYSVVTGEALY